MKNPLLVKKLGEVLAFAQIGQELLVRAGETGKTAFGATMALEMNRAFDQQVLLVGKIADQAKAQRTTKKLRSMMDQYVGNEWDNPTEILEWAGFYLGSAGVHWSFVSSLADDSKLQTFASNQAHAFFRWLEHASEQIKTSSS